jgi:hypothetical protein
MMSKARSANIPGRAIFLFAAVLILFAGCKEQPVGDTEGTLANPKILTVRKNLGTMTEAGSGWRQVLSVIELRGEYVTLDLSACTMDGTEFNPDSRILTGKGKIVSIILPDVATGIAGGTSISSAAFSYFYALTSFSGAGITSVGTYAFYNCTKLSQITLSENLVSIGSRAFHGCTNLAGITLPESVTFIGGSAFARCPNIVFTVTGSGSLSLLDGGRALVWDGTELLAYPSASGSITLPENVTSVGGYAFNGCTGLVQITLPENVTSVGDYAFSGCKGLTQITLPGSLNSLGQAAFDGCTSLVQITLPGNVTSVGDYTFNGCINLAEVTLPQGLISVGAWAFGHCASLTQITLPGSLTSLGNWAFADTGLTKITLPEGLTSVGYQVFSNCTNLAQIEFPEGILSIGEQAFTGCRGLTQITLPENLVSIGVYAFSGCRGLTQITLPESLEYIGPDSFYGCTNLAGITLPAGLVSISGNSFADCPKLVFTLTGDGSLSVLEEGRALVRDGTELLAYPSASGGITLPESITSVGRYAFYYCANLVQINFPQTLISVGDYAFYRCTNLVLVTCNAPTPPEIGRYVFYNSAIVFYPPPILENLQIRVPAGSVEAYKAAENWSGYAGRIAAIE